MTGRRAWALVLAVWAAPVGAADLVFVGPDTRLVVPGEALVSVQLGKDMSDRWAVIVRMGPEDARAFTDLTWQAVGQAISVQVCGEEIVRPVVRSPIIGGMAQLSATDRAAAERFVAHLTGALPCP